MQMFSGKGFELACHYPLCVDKTSFKVIISLTWGKF